MKAKDLRIGNLVSVDDFSTIVKSITDYGINIEGVEDGEIIEFAGFHDLELRPIKLNKEWLNKLGFEKINDSQDDSIHSMGFIINEVIHLYADCQDGYSNVYPSFIDSEGGDTRIADNLYFVHQIQNFYHSFTGRELESERGVSITRSK